jgi:dTDP-glucose 4,6-dehydratase
MVTKNNKFVVVGSNSFSGASFVSCLLKNDIEVVGIGRSQEPNSVFLPYKWCGRSHFKFCQMDLNRHLPDIMGVINDFRPDYVVNFAAQSMVAESWQHPEHWFQTNTVATVKLHDELRKLNFLKKYVHVSTPEVYGACGGLIKEHTSYNPSTPYAVSRAAADMSLMSFYKAYNFPVVFTRAANVFGPGQQLYRIIPRTILFFMLDKKLQLHGGGHSVRSFIHIRDVADGTYRAATDAPIGETYHFSTTRNISIREVVKMIAEQMNVSFEDKVDAVGERLGKDSAYLLDSAKAIETLGWKPQIELEQGIEETIRWVGDNLDVLSKQPFDYVHKE